MRVFLIFQFLIVGSLFAEEFIVPSIVWIGHKAQLDRNLRKSSYPYISPDTFRSFATFIYDESCVPLDTDKVEVGDTVFVHGDFLDHFFKLVHPAITVPYILITHQSDLTIKPRFKKFLGQDKIIAWFARNTGFNHPKLVVIPVGFANAYWPHGKTALVEQVLSEEIERDELIYVNINVSTNINKRKPVYDYFKGQSFCSITPRKNYVGYLRDLARSKFVVSPLGNGLDCHRTWEAMIMGVIPIVESSTIDAVFEDLPVLIVTDWKQITQEFLEQKYEEFGQRTFRKEKLYVQYWFDLINKTKAEFIDFYNQEESLTEQIEDNYEI